MNSRAPLVVKINSNNLEELDSPATDCTDAPEIEDLITETDKANTDMTQQSDKIEESLGFVEEDVPAVIPTETEGFTTTGMIYYTVM